MKMIFAGMIMSLLLPSLSILGMGITDTLDAEIISMQIDDPQSTLPSPIYFIEQENEKSPADDPFGLLKITDKLELSATLKNVGPEALQKYLLWAYKKYLEEKKSFQLASVNQENFKLELAQHNLSSLQQTVELLSRQKNELSALLDKELKQLNDYIFKGVQK